MPYPPRYQPKNDFAQDDQQGLPVDGTALAVELANISESIAQIIGFIKAGFAANRKWLPSSAVEMDLAEEFTFTASAGQTVFAFPGGVEANPTYDKARVFINGALLDPGSVTLGTTGVTLPAQIGGEIVVVELFNDNRKLRDDLASTAAGLGASLVAIEDKLGNLSADNVEDALSEIKILLDQVAAAVGTVAGIVRDDGSVPFAADQSMGGYELTDLADGTAPTSAATVNQLNALAAIYGDLGNLFLALAGGIMSGNIDMGTNHLLNVKDAANPTDAPNWGQVQAAIAAFSGAFLPLVGGTMAGEINMKANDKAIRVRAAADADEPVRKDQVDGLIQDAVEDLELLGSIGGTGILGSYPPDPACPCLTAPPDFGLASGVYDYRDLAIPAAPPVSMGYAVAIRATGDLSLAGVTLACLPRGGYFARRTREGDLGAVMTFNGATEYYNRNCAGVGGGSPTTPLFSQPAAIVRGIIDDHIRSNSKPHELSSMLWADAAFLLGAGDAVGGGALRILVDGDINMEGALLTANGLAAAASDTSPGGGGGGSIVIVCRGTIACGAGATLIANGGDAAFFNDVIAGPIFRGFYMTGGGGGYVAVVAREITGQLNIECRGGSSANPNVPHGNGGYAEVLTSIPAVLAPAINVTQGAGGLVTAFTQDGNAIVGSIEAARIPAAGGLI